MKLHLAVICVSTICVSTLVFQVAHAREWSDASGIYHFRGDLIECEGNMVRLQSAAGKRVSCKWELLSTADQQYIRQVGRHAPDSSSDTTLPTSAALGTAKALPVAAVTTTTDLAEFRPRRWATAVATSAQTKVQAPKPPGKRIFSGHWSTFQLNGATGTGAYWLRGNDGYAHHYLTTLTFHGYDGSGKYLVYTSVGLEGGVYGWYFYDQATCGCAGSSIYDIGAAGNPKFYEQDYREIPE